MGLRHVLRGRREVPPPPGFETITPPSPPTDEIIHLDERQYHAKARSSPDGTWRIAYGRDMEAEETRVFAFHENDLSFHVEAERVEDAVIANEGTVMVLEGGSFDRLEGRVSVIDSTGSESFSESFPVNVRSVSISADGRRGAVVTRPPQSAIHLLDLPDGGMDAVTEELDDGLRPLGFTAGRDESLLYLARRENDEPYVAVDMSGEIAWRSEEYRDTEPLSKRLRTWVGSFGHQKG